jgi:dolichol-phosphate mannosyltransferase
MVKISIVIPVYYNEFNLEPLYNQLSETVFSKSLFDYELIFVDDGSGDNSYNVLKSLADRDSKIKLIKLSRNFGSHTAILAGFSYATGECTTVVAADSQEPPEIILEMFNKWQEGNNVVLAVRKDREESTMQKLFSNTYYKLLKKYALPNMPEGGFDCFLIDQKVVSILKEVKEKNSTLMGQILWCGFKTEKIYYVRKKREIGESRWTLKKKIKLFVDSFTAFSYLPIKIITILGITSATISLCMILFYVLNRIINNITLEGWTTLIVTILFFSGVQLITLGVIGEYIWRIFDEARNRPTFIVEDSYNVEIKLVNKNDQQI